MTCTTEGCTAPVSAKGLCHKHYNEAYYRARVGREPRSYRCSRCDEVGHSVRTCRRAPDVVEVNSWG